MGMFDITVIEQAAFMYLRSVSFNGITVIFRSWFEKDVFSKPTLIQHIELLSDKLPSQKEITKWLKPKRSGYFALDGTWMKYRGEDFVLLILFDVKTLDIVNWHVAKEEEEISYTELIKEVYNEISPKIKGFFCDGEPSALKVLKNLFPGTPIQLCVFHKYSRVGQIIPFIRTKKEIDKIIKEKVEKILFASDKKEAEKGLVDLERYARKHQEYDKLQKILGVLKRNFELLLTHFDNPEMSPYNNALEGFNYMVKRKTRLMKGFKKSVNIHRWLKLILLDWRFHKLSESSFKYRKNKSPLELSGCQLPEIYNWMTFVRKKYPEKST